MGEINPALLILFGTFIGLILMFFINYFRVNGASKKVEKILEAARKDADKIKRDSLFEIKEESYKLKNELDKELKEKKEVAKEAENRLIQRENNMDRRDQTLQKREASLEERENNLILKNEDLQNRKVELDNVMNEQLTALEQISKFSKEKAHDEVMKRVEENMSLEIANYIKECETDAKLEVDRKAKQMLVSSMEKYAADVASEQTVTVVTLPSDEMKGRIIGREGRNIRTLEAVTGVDLIIDDTPEAVVLSSFDPYRREIARTTLETLIKDGRIHPSRIEELYSKISKDMKTKTIETGNSAMFELGISKLDAELVELIGKLKYRTSYGQNGLQHSMEVAHLTGIMAAELGENVLLAKRAGLLHDIGKAIDHEVEGSHVEIGADIARKHNESDVVINAIESHHGDKEATSIISVLVAMADALSASRPGARNDSLENYIKRLSEMEKIASDVKGVEKSFAMQAGRELRVIVKPEQIDDAASYRVAKDIKEKIEKDMQYPGTVKITVIRETRATEEAK